MMKYKLLFLLWQEAIWQQEKNHGLKKPVKSKQSISCKSNRLWRAVWGESSLNFDTCVADTTWGGGVLVGTDKKSYPMWFPRYHTTSLLMRNLDSSCHGKTGSILYISLSWVKLGESVTGRSKRSNAEQCTQGSSCKHTASENIPKQPENICSIKIERNHALSPSGGRYNVTLFHL